MTQPLPDLTQTDAAGIYPLSPTQCAGLPEAAQHAGLAFHELDLGALRDLADLFARLEQALQLPVWFGHNWDALADCLGDLSWQEASGHVLHIRHQHELAAKHPALHEQLHEVLLDTCLYWQDEGLPFWVFINTPADH